MKKTRIEVSAAELEYIVESLVSSIYNDLPYLKGIDETPAGVIAGWKKYRPQYIRRLLKVGTWKPEEAVDARALHDFEAAWLKRLLPFLPEVAS